MRPGGTDWLTDDYEFVRTLGRGAAGWVVLARQRSLDRLVAVKTVVGTDIRSATAERVRREGRILASMRCESIVTVYQLIPQPDRISLVMEYLAGGDLDRALDAGTLVRPQLLDTLAQVAEALTVAAAAGVVHRDVKPSNVLLAGDGRAVLADFGLARLRSPGGFRTAAGTVTGTPRFLAPEQIDNPDDESPASDAYSFGVLAYRAVTGRHPFDAATVDQLYEAHRTATPPAPTDLDPTVPRRANDALLRALDKNPARRLMPAELVAALRTGPWASVRRSAGSSSAGSSTAGPNAGGSSAGGSAAPRAVPTDPEPTAHGDATSAADAPDTADHAPVFADATGDPDGTTRRDAGPVPEQWISPPVYRVRRHSPWPRLLLAVLLGLVVGVGAYLILAGR